MDTYDSTVINCLQDFNSEIKNTECKRLVKKYIALASEDIRFDVPLAEACAEDRQKLCSAVAPVRVAYACMQVYIQTYAYCTYKCILKTGWGAATLFSVNS